MYCVGFVSGGTYQGKTVIEQVRVRKPEYESLPVFSYHIRDKESGNIYVGLKDSNKKTIHYLLRQYNDGNLRFTSDYGRADFKNYILPELKKYMEE